MVVMLHNYKPAVTCLNVEFVQGCLGFDDYCTFERAEANLKVKAKFWHRAGQLVAEEVVAVFLTCHLLGQRGRVEEQRILQVAGKLCQKLGLGLAAATTAVTLVLAIVGGQAELLGVIKGRAITFTATDAGLRE